jgi:hypothetical protein
MEGIFRDEGKRWVERAIAFYEATGKTITLAEFSNPRGPFVWGDQYVYLLDTTGTMLAHPLNGKYTGKDFYGVQDAEGKCFFKDIVDTANTKGYGWVSYKCFDPATKSALNKMVYFEKVDDMIFCSDTRKGKPVYGPSNGRQSNGPSVNPRRRGALRSLIQRLMSI